MAKVLLFGEALIRISPSDYQTFSHQVTSRLYYGGSEVNIARALQGFESDSKLLTALPQNPIGDHFLDFLKANHIDTSVIQRHQKRLGVYYFQRPFGCRQAEIAYDRDDTCFHQIDMEEIDLESLFLDVAIFHLSGITLALSKALRQKAQWLIKEAKKRGILISLDLNFRRHLMEPLEAKKVFTEIADKIDICFGIEPLMLTDDDTDFFDRDNASLEMIHSRMKELLEKFNFQYIFHTYRKQDAYGRNHFNAYLYSKANQLSKSETVKTSVIDRIGSGDAFVAGALHQLLTNENQQEIISFAVAAASLKCTIEGDNMYEKPEKIKSVLCQTNDINR